MKKIIINGNNESLTFYKTALNFIKDWVYWRDRSGNFIYLSPATKEITGYEPEEFIKDQNLFEKIIHPEDLESVKKKSNREKNNKKDCTNEFRIITKEGEIKYIKHTCTPVISEKGEIIGRIATNRDVTDLILTKEQTKKPEKLFRLLLDSIPDPVNMIDKEYKIVFANKKLLSMIGKKLEDIRGKHCYKIYQKRDTECEICAPRKVFKTGKTASVEKEITLPNNEKKYFETRAFPVLDSKGNILYVIEVTRDITEKKKIEKDLLESKFKYEMLSQKAPLGILSMDLNGNIDYVNEKTLEILGSPSAEATKKINIFKFPPLIRAGIADKIKISIQKGIDQIYEGSYTSKWRKEIFMRLHITPLKTKGKITGALTILEDFTEKKKIEQSLEKSNKMFYGIFLNTKNGIVIADKDYVIQDINPAVEELTGYSKKELVGKTIFEANYLLLPEKKTSLKKYISNIKRKLNEKETPQFIPQFINYKELNIKRKDNQIRTIHQTSFIVSAENENFIIAISRDITNEKKMLEELKKSEKKYKELSQLFRLVADNNPDMVWARDLNGRYIFINKSMAVDFYGFNSPDEATNLTHKEIIKKIKNENPSKKDWFYVDKNPIDYEKIVINEKRPVRYDMSGFIRGKYFYLDIYKAPLINENGKIIGIVGSSRDITNQKKLEGEKEQALKAIQRLAEVIRQSSEAIVITDKAAKIIYVNPAFEKITGYKLKEVISKNPKILKSGKMNKDFYKNLWETILEGKPWNGTFINKKKDGSIFYESATIFPIFNEKGEITNFAAVKRDITGEKKLEEQLIQAQKMEAIGTLTGGIAHDFNNLLTVINGYTDMALKRFDENDPSYKIFKAINGAGIKAEKLVKHLLAFSRKQVYNPKIVNINTIIKNLKKLLTRYLSEDIKLDLALNKDIANIKADPNQIEQILINLVVNARDAINEKKDKKSLNIITIETGNVRIKNDYVLKHPGSRIGNFVFFAVSDTGIGIDDSIKEKIFDPFFSTKGKAGSGLGLSTVYGIVKQNNGFVYAYSEKGKGTTIKVYWPATKLKEDKVEEKIKDEEEILGGSEILLFVEDEKEILKFAATGLKSLGYKVITAPNGREALKVIKEKRVKPDILITDLIMPKMDGEELAKEMKKRFPRIKVIYTSGYTNNHIVNKGILDKRVNFISKPYTITELNKKIREVMKKKK